MARPSALPVHPKDLALTLLRKQKRPMSAYDILEKLRPSGVRAAPVVYRALEALIKEGLVHRIQTLNAYLACNCSSEHDHAISVLTICSQCRAVEELHDHGVIHQLEALRMQGVPIARHAVIELPIQCCAPPPEHA